MKKVLQLFKKVLQNLLIQSKKIPRNIEYSTFLGISLQSDRRGSKDDLRKLQRACKH